MNYPSSVSQPTSPTTGPESHDKNIWSHAARWGLAALLLAVAWWLFRFLPTGCDWNTVAAVAHSWREPYVVASFYNPPWVAPVVALIYPFGQAGLAVITLVAMALLVRQLDGGPLETVLVLTSPPVVNLIQNGNIDGLVLLGLVVPLPLGLVFLSMKPQTAGWAAVYLWTRHPYKLRTLLPLAVVVAGSLAVWGWWPAQMLSRSPSEAFWNVAPWPYLMPVGVWLLAQAWRQQDWSLALAGNVFLWPYSMFLSMVGLAAVLVVKMRWRLALVSMVVWWAIIIFGAGV